MAALSNFAENEMLDHMLGTGAYTAPSNVFLSLWTSDPTDAGSGTELSGSGYVRKDINFGASSSGVATSSGVVTFDTASGSWGTVTHIGIHDAVSSGNLLFHGALTASKAIGSGDVMQIANGAITITAA
tara:strand:+ start:872 stop:1258 length:387 start_codon:yes stop_codon:yes gene_type:complete